MPEKNHAFSPDGETCVITDPQPPRYWYNYLWNDLGFCAQVSQTGHGDSYYITARAEMCRLNAGGARYIYLRDERDGSAWNIGRAPLLAPVEDFRCTHHLASTIVSSRRDGIEAAWRLCVPPGEYAELWTVSVRNLAAEPRRLSLFAAVNFELEGFSYPRYYEMYRFCETSYDPDLNGVYCRARHPHAPHARYNGYLASSAAPVGFEGDLAAFFGPIGSFARPELLLSGRSCKGSCAALEVLGAVLQHRLDLAPGEEAEIHYLYGVAESPHDARAAAARLFAPGAAGAAADAAAASCRRRYGTLAARTPEARWNNLMNGWLMKQVDFCIVGKKGVRDNLQIADALLLYLPERAKQEILECLRHQFRDGHTVLTWYPYDDTHYSDQPIWIVMAVTDLIRETGDFTVLDEILPYQDGGEGTVYEHMCAGLARLIADRGPHGLPLLRFADWNDALNVTTDPEAESVFIAMGLLLMLREMAILAERRGEKAQAEQWCRELYDLKGIVQREAWDGRWFLRALTKDGPIGGHGSAGSKIYLNPQVWAILADAATPEQTRLMLEAVDTLMEHDFGFPINSPAYEEYNPMTGRMSAMLPGLYENGGVYCHASAFKIMADCKLGRGVEAHRTLDKIMPDSPANPSLRSGAEPYVFTNCYALHPKFYGKSYMSWQTGTSAWCLKGLYEGILGVRADYDGLVVDPCLPPHWPEAEMRRRFRGADYHIVIKNPDGISRGKLSLSVDGKPVEGGMVPAFGDGRTHEVEAIIRRP